MKTKEEILKKQVFKLSNLGGFEIEALEAMQEYADQQTEQLKKQLEEKEKELSELKAKHKEEIIKFSEFLKDYEYIMSLGLKYGAYVNKNEVDIYVNGSELHYQNLVLNHGKSINELYEQYYTQTHGQ